MSFDQAVDYKPITFEINLREAKNLKHASIILNQECMDKKKGIVKARKIIGNILSECNDNFPIEDEDLSEELA